MNSGRGSDELAGASVNSAVLSTSNETPFVDHLLTEPSENVFTSLHSSSLPMPVREEGMDSGPASLEKGMCVCVFVNVCVCVFACVCTCTCVCKFVYL